MSARRDPRSFLGNFAAYDAPLGERLRLAVRNNWRKVTTRSACCGHPGEPGC